MGHRLCTRILAALALAFSVVAHADVTITTECRHGLGPDADVVTLVHYYSATKFRAEQSDYGAATIFDLEKQCMITLLTSVKQYFVWTFAYLKEVSGHNPGKSTPPSFKYTDEEAEIAGYSCSKVIVKYEADGRVHYSESWVTKDVEIDKALLAYAQREYELFKGVDGSGQAAEIRKTFLEKGLFTIKTRYLESAPNGTPLAISERTVTKIEVGELDEDLFVVPDGYVKVGEDEPVDVPEEEPE